MENKDFIFFKFFSSSVFCCFCLLPLPLSPPSLSLPRPSSSPSSLSQLGQRVTRLFRA